MTQPFLQSSLFETPQPTISGLTYIADFIDAATEAAIVELLRQMRASGKTVIVVHHDLQTVQDYFDWVLLLNMRLVAFGPMETTFTNGLLQKTYGGRLSLLTEVADLIRDQQRKERDPL